MNEEKIKTALEIVDDHISKLDNKDEFKVACAILINSARESIGESPLYVVLGNECGRL